jgi:hypothetical protein
VVAVAQEKLLEQALVVPVVAAEQPLLLALPVIHQALHHHKAILVEMLELGLAELVVAVVVVLQIRVAMEAHQHQAQLLVTEVTEPHLLFQDRP